MHLDVQELRNFYYRTRLGRAAQKAIRDQLCELWPPAPGQRVAGFGFAVPLLRPYLGPARRVVGLMPGPQGVMPWPAGMPNVSVLCAETHWPLEPESADRLVLLHALEFSEQPTALLRECWRVLAPGGRIVVIVPNRAGLWTRREGTPFGHGRPYSPGQLQAQLRNNDFAPERVVSALYAPPSDRRFWLRTAGFWERGVRKMMPWRAGGVLMVEAVKQVQAPTRGGLGEMVRRPLRVLEGAGAEPSPT
ncbi:MAG: methyltransferase domain-containing protein [Gemmobacter sp.]